MNTDNKTLAFQLCEAVAKISCNFNMDNWLDLSEKAQAVMRILVTDVEGGSGQIEDMENSPHGWVYKIGETWYWVESNCDRLPAYGMGDLRKATEFEKQLVDVLKGEKGVRVSVTQTQKLLRGLIFDTQ